MNFFDSQCQSGPHAEAQFGVCDDQNFTRAYVDTASQEKWVATVNNPSRHDVFFTAIDKCVLQDGDEPNRGRCDGMLTTDRALYLVELKDQRANWREHAVTQLFSTVEFLHQHHSAELQRFQYKKAFACNKRHPAFVVVQHEEKRRFQRLGFRVDIQATVVVVPAT